MEYRLQSMHHHMVGRAASVVPPFHFIFFAADRPEPIFDSRVQ